MLVRSIISFRLIIQYTGKKSDAWLHLVNVMCATGNGIMIAANKVKGIRCAMAYGDEVTARMKQHNDANVVAFGQMFMDYDDIIRRMDIFLETPFSGGYHIPRIEQIRNIEENKPLVQSPLIDKNIGGKKR